MQKMQGVSPSQVPLDRDPSFHWESRDDSPPTASFLEWAFQHSPAGMVLLSPEARVLSVNPVAGRWLGGTTEVIQGTPFTDWLTEAGVASFRAFLEQWTTPGTNRAPSRLPMRKTGKTVQMTGAAAPGKNGWFITLEEATEAQPTTTDGASPSRKDSEAAGNPLDPSVEEPRILIEPDTHKLVDCNEAAVERFGFARAELLSMNWAYFSLTGTPGETAALFARILQGEVVSFTVSLRGAQGEVRIFESTGQLLVKEGKALISWTGTDRTQAVRRKNDLGDRERIFSTIIGQALDGIVLVDLSNGRFTAFNEAAHRGLGYTQAEFSELTLGAIAQPHSASGAEPKRMPGATTASRGPCSDLPHYPLGGGVFETTHLHKDGSLRNVRVSTRKIALGAREYLASIWTDITERKKAENALWESEHRFQAAFDSASIGMAVVSPEGRYLKVNRSLIQMLGYTEEELLGRSFQELTHPEDIRNDLNNLRMMMAGQIQQSQCTKRYLDKSGKLVWVRLSVSAVHQPGESPLFFVSQYQNITDQKRSEALLAESENRFLNAFEHAATGQALFSLEGQWLKVNQALCEILGYAEGELLASNIQEQSHPEDMRITEFHADRLRRGEVKSAKYRKRYIHKKGHAIWAAASVSIVRNDAGEPLYFVSQIQDITEQLRTLEALTESENKERIRREEIETLLEVLPTPIWISKDPEGHTIQGNRAACEILGLPYGGNLARWHDAGGALANQFFRNGRPVTLNDFFIGIDFPSAPEPWNRAATDFEEWEIRRPDGSSSFLFGRTVQLLDIHGKPRGLIAAAVDITERKRTEAALIESEERWKFALEGAGEGAWDWNVQSGVVHFSKRWKEMLGYKNDEIGSTLEEWSSRVHPEDLPKTLKAKQDYFQETTTVYQNEHRMRTKAGNWQWHLSRAKLMSRDERGRPLRMIGTHADISERKSLEARESSRSKIMTMIATGESLKTILLALAHDAEAQHPGSKCSILLLDTQEKRLRIGAAPHLPDFFNRAVDGVLIGPEVGSCGTAAYLGKRVIVEDIYRDSKWILYADLTRAANLGACWSEPVFNSSREVLGTFAIYHELPHSPSPAELETIAVLAQFAGVAIERKRADDRLLANQRLLGEAELLAKSGAWVWEVEDDSWFVSEGLMRILGSSSRDLPQGGLVRFCHPADRPRLEALMAQLVADKSPLDLELRILKEGTGTVRWLALHGMLFEESPGNSVVYGAVQDITARKKAGKTLERRERELLRSNSDLQQFAYAASHDLQEPLRMVSGFTQLLAKKYGGKLDEKAQQFIKYSVDGCTRMKHLIDDLLEYSRVGIRAKALEAVHCDTILDQCLTNLGPALAESQLQVRRSELPRIQANGSQMLQVFQNLLSNSLKFRNARAPWVSVFAQEKEHAWVISVEDNGIGIALPFRQRVFELFQRLHTRDKYPGTGMGLAICKKIVERHGGRIWLETPPSGEGIRVCIQWPKNHRRPKVPGRQPPPSGPASSTGPL